MTRSLASFGLTFALLTGCLLATDGSFAATDPDTSPSTVARSFAVAVHGEGPPVILIPGLASPGSVWEGMVDRLGERYTFHVLTLAGFAHRPPLTAFEATERPFLDTVTRDLVAYARTLEQPAVVGHSLGGFLAFRLGVEHGDVFGPLVAVDGVPFLPALANPAATEVSASAGAESLRTMVSSLTGDQFRQQNRMTLASMVSDPAAVEPLAESSGGSDPATVGRAMAELMTYDLRDELTTLATPMLLIGARGSLPGAPAERVDAAYAAQVAASSWVQVEMVDTRHFVMLDDPDGLAAILDRFLSAQHAPLMDGAR